MARLVLLACLMLGVVSVSASNRLDVEHCSEDCTKHCGKRTRYITGKCVETAAGSYKAMCTPGGAWKIENYLEKGCTGNKEGNDMQSDNTCLPFPKKLPVKYESYDKAGSQVTVKICDKIDNKDDAAECTAVACEEKMLLTTSNCAQVDGTSYYYAVTVTGEDDSATATLALYDDAKLCEAAVSPVFYKENMAKGDCATYRQALKGTCTPITRTKTVSLPPTTTSNTTTGSSTTSTSTTSTTSTDATSNNTTTDGDSSSAVCGSLATALLAVLAVLLALY